MKTGGGKRAGLGTCSTLRSRPDAAVVLMVARVAHRKETQNPHPEEHEQ